MTTTQTTEPTANNMAIWERVQQTDPNHTKEFNRGGGFKGTAINPTYMAQKATEVFGPMGKGWGVEILDESLMEGAPIFNGNGQPIGKELVHKLRVRLWYVLDGERYDVVQFGQTTFVGKNKYGPFTDEEAPKKSLTDGMTKCLSLLGFSADVHMGRYDDNKYVNDLRQQAAQNDKAASQNQNGQQRQAPPKSPKVDTIAVPQGKDGNPDWPAFTKAMGDAIGKAPDDAHLNALLKAHNSALSNLKGHDAKAFDGLRDVSDRRRAFFAQEVSNPQAAE